MHSRRPECRPGRLLSSLPQCSVRQSQTVSCRWNCRWSCYFKRTESLVFMGLFPSNHLTKRQVRSWRRSIYLVRLVGARGFEPPTPCAQGRCATRLRYAPTMYLIHPTLSTKVRKSPQRKPWWNCTKLSGLGESPSQFSLKPADLLQVCKTVTL